MTEHRIQTVAGLVLAAGFSRRFGGDKRAARLSSGQTLLGASLALPCMQLDEVWVVLRAEDDSTALGVPAQVQVIHNDCAELGMGHSLASGVRAVSQLTKAHSLAIFLGDMPWISAASLSRLLALASSGHIVVPTFQGQPGHPVIFGRRFWPALQSLSGETGAKSVIQAHSQAVRRLQLNDPGILRDVDTPRFIE